MKNILAHRAVKLNFSKLDRNSTVYNAFNYQLLKACRMKMIRCATDYPTHVVIHLLSIKLWSQTQALWITNHHITFNPLAPMPHPDSITIINHLSSTIIACCRHPLLQRINSITCIFISVYKLKINIVFVFELCLVSDERIYPNLQPMIFHHKKKILLRILIIFGWRKMNYNM